MRNNGGGSSYRLVERGREGNGGMRGREMRGRGRGGGMSGCVAIYEVGETRTGVRFRTLGRQIRIPFMLPRNSRGGEGVGGIH